MTEFNEIILRSGRRVLLYELHQVLTYDGLREGLPTLEMNKAMMEDLVAERHGKPYPVGPVCLIKPEQRLIDYFKKYAFGVPAILPAVTCMGRFESRETPITHSGLVIIWYQEQFAFPIDPAVIEKMECIDWERLAVNIGL
jgi:hypothetical protein